MSIDPARHYDALDDAYRRIWGEHVHHGLWRTGFESPPAAVRALIDVCAAHAALPPRPRIADAGCGYGGTARVLAAAHGAEVVGLTLSPAQAAYAQTHARPGVEVRVGDWLANGLEAGSFDAVLAIESLSHMPDIALAFAQAARVLKPGGRFVLVDWLAGARGGPAARGLRTVIERTGHLPRLYCPDDYLAFGRAAGLDALAWQDFTKPARRTWTLVAGRLARLLVTDAGARRSLLGPSNPERAFGLSLAAIPLAYRVGAMRLGLLAFVKA